MKTNYTMKILFRILLAFGVLWAAGGAYSEEVTLAKPILDEPTLEEPTVDQPTAACKNPDIKIVNSSSYDITIKRMNYRDGCDAKTRGEELTDVFLPHGYYVIYHDDLEYVQSCTIPWFQVKFKWGSSDYWSDAITPDEGSKVKCVSGRDYTITLTDTNLF